LTTISQSATIAPLFPILLEHSYGGDWFRLEQYGLCACRTEHFRYAAQIA